MPILDALNATVTGHDVFVDILSLLLAILGVISVLIYGILYKTLTRSITLAAKREMHKAIVGSYLSIGQLYWEDFRRENENRKKAGNKNRDHTLKLTLAISITERARKDYAYDLDEKDPKSKRLICWLRSNLAYYYAEKQVLNMATDEERASAREYVKYVCGQIDQCAKDKDERKELVDNCKFVDDHIPLEKVSNSTFAQKILGRIGIH